VANRKEILDELANDTECLSLSIKDVKNTHILEKDMFRNKCEDITKALADGKNTDIVLKTDISGTGIIHATTAKSLADFLNNENYLTKLDTFDFIKFMPEAPKSKTDSRFI